MVLDKKAQSLRLGNIKVLSKNLLLDIQFLQNLCI